jgi:hypothetical protein
MEKQDGKIFTEDERIEIENAFYIIKDYVTGGLCDRVRRDYYAKLDNPETKDSVLYYDRCHYCLLNKEHGMFCEWGKMLQAYEKMMQIDSGEEEDE